MRRSYVDTCFHDILTTVGHRKRGFRDTTEGRRRIKTQIGSIIWLVNLGTFTLSYTFFFFAHIWASQKQVGTTRLQAIFSSAHCWNERRRLISDKFSNNITSSHFSFQFLIFFFFPIILFQSRAASCYSLRTIVICAQQNRRRGSCKKPRRHTSTKEIF